MLSSPGPEEISPTEVKTQIASSIVITSTDRTQPQPLRLYYIVMSSSHLQSLKYSHVIIEPSSIHPIQTECTSQLPRNTSFPSLPSVGKMGQGTTTAKYAKQTNNALDDDESASNYKPGLHPPAVVAGNPQERSELAQSRNNPADYQSFQKVLRTTSTKEIRTFEVITGFL